MCNYCVLTPNTINNLNLRQQNHLLISTNQSAQSQQSSLINSAQSNQSNQSNQILLGNSKVPPPILSATQPTASKLWSKIVAGNNNVSLSNNNSTNSNLSTSSSGSSLNSLSTSSSGSSLNSLSTSSSISNLNSLSTSSSISNLNSLSTSSSGSSLNSRRSSNYDNLNRQIADRNNSLSTMHNGIKCNCNEDLCAQYDGTLNSIDRMNIQYKLTRNPDRGSIICGKCGCELRSKLYATAKRNPSNVSSPERRRSLTPPKSTGHELTSWTGAAQLFFKDNLNNFQYFEIQESDIQCNKDDILLGNVSNRYLPYLTDYVFQDITSLKSSISPQKQKNLYYNTVFVHGGAQALARAVIHARNNRINYPDYSSLVLFESSVCYDITKTANIYSCLQCLRFWGLLALPYLPGQVSIKYTANGNLSTQARKTQRDNGQRSNHNISSSGKAGWVITDEMITAIQIVHNISREEALNILSCINLNEAQLRSLDYM
ncbi:hypothetical protein QEJ31_08110 [Pigmentibacter sp. JX0631]|uniref:hypothetical protein n=1 Tax=Pigmentibacter sp. JX0631 TaxID=2976982 RepID=UPI002468FA86|nr:hypothetical protein [Pigmentibacter sp. JX0631]WGL58504.1 hypothetical protein QEJ31_08110 [Pigmentibacter sp. JX0631]